MIGNDCTRYVVFLSSSKSSNTGIYQDEFDVVETVQKEIDIKKQKLSDTFISR